MFRNIMVLLLVLVPGSVWAGEAAWLPTKQQAGFVEAHLTMPKGSDPLVTYDRYYAGIWVNGRRTILGYFVGSTKKGGSVHIVSELPLGVADGGCSVVKVYFDVATNKQVAASCNGVA